MSSPSRPTALFLLSLLPTALAIPLEALPLAARDALVQVSGPNVTVVDSGTGRTIMQAPASDGSGFGFDAPAVLWLVAAFVAGAPLAVAGLRLGRLSCALAITCAMTLLGASHPA